MGISRLGCSGFFILGTLLFLTSCPGPTYDQALLSSVKAEADRLRATTSDEGFITLRKGQWPKAIARLDPERVWVSRHRVEVLKQGYFDGGWGYVIPEEKRFLGMMPECFSEIAPGVYWHGPC